MFFLPMIWITHLLLISNVFCMNYDYDLHYILHHFLDQQRFLQIESKDHLHLDPIPRSHERIQTALHNQQVGQNDQNIQILSNLFTTVPLLLHVNDMDGIISEVYKNILDNGERNKVIRAAQMMNSIPIDDLSHIPLAYQIKRVANALINAPISKNLNRLRKFFVDYPELKESTDYFTFQKNVNHKLTRYSNRYKAELKELGNEVVTFVSHRPYIQLHPNLMHLAMAFKSLKWKTDFSKFFEFWNEYPQFHHMTYKDEDKMNELKNVLASRNDGKMLINISTLRQLRFVDVKYIDLKRALRRLYEADLKIRKLQKNDSNT